MGRRRTEETMIGDIEVSCQTHGALDAHELLVDLANAVGGAVTTIADALEKDAEISALSGMFTAIDAKVTRGLIVRILRHTRATYHKEDGTKLSTELSSEKAFELVFGDDLMAVYTAVKFALQVNYSGFFDVLVDAYNQTRASVDESSKSPKESSSN